MLTLESNNNNNNSNNNKQNEIYLFKVHKNNCISSNLYLNSINLLYTLIFLNIQIIIKVCLT